MEKAERLREGGASFQIEPCQLVVIGYENETRVLFSDQYFLVPHYVRKANGSSHFWGFLDERHTKVFSAPSDYSWPAAPLNVGWSASHFPSKRLNWHQFKVTPGFKPERARAAIEEAQAAIEEVCSFSPPAINL
jgi:hypothetical protein